MQLKKESYMWNAFNSEKEYKRFAVQTAHSYATDYEQWGFFEGAWL